jgi:PIN domain nuclease of toxin-antitoxin system
VIILDTHVWVWWVDGGNQLPPDYQNLIRTEEPNGLGVCAISCWEVAKLVELGRLQLACPVDQW